MKRLEAIAAVGERVVDRERAAVGCSKRELPSGVVEHLFVGAFDGEEVVGGDFIRRIEVGDELGVCIGEGNRAGEDRILVELEDVVGTRDGEVLDGELLRVGGSVDDAAARHVHRGDEAVARHVPRAAARELKHQAFGLGADLKVRIIAWIVDFAHRIVRGERAPRPVGITVGQLDFDVGVRGGA